MVAAGAVPNRPGLRLTAAELLALRTDMLSAARHRPATRRPGAAPARSPGTGMDLREIRAYVPGDDPRRIDPAATARTGQPHVRSFHEDRDDTTLLIADFRAPMLWGTGDSLRSVRAAHYLVRLGWQATRRGGTVAVLAITGGGAAELRAGAGDRQMTDVAQMLATEHDTALTHAADPPLAAGLARAGRLAPPGGRVILATAPGAWGDAETTLARLARRRRLTVALMLDPLERMAPAMALTVSDGAATRHARLAVPDLGGELARLRALGAEPVEVAR